MCRTGELELGPRACKGTLSKASQNRTQLCGLWLRGTSCKTGVRLIFYFNQPHTRTWAQRQSSTMSFFHRENSITGITQSDDGTALRLVHGRLLCYIAAHNALSKATLELADSIVEFYSPEVRTCLACVQCATAHCDCLCLPVCSPVHEHAFAIVLLLSIGMEQAEALCALIACASGHG